MRSILWSLVAVLLVGGVMAQSTNEAVEEPNPCPDAREFSPCNCRQLYGTYIQCVRTDLDTVIDKLRKHITVPIQRLVIRASRIPKIPNHAFQGLDIKQLYIIECGLQHIGKRAFTSLKHSLEMLYLNNNEIVNIPQGALKDLSSVLTLYLNKNNLTEIPPGLFSGMTNLTYLWLNDNKISHIMPGTFDGKLLHHGRHLGGDWRVSAHAHSSTLTANVPLFQSVLNSIERTNPLVQCSYQRHLVAKTLT